MALGFLFNIVLKLTFLLIASGVFYYYALFAGIEPTSKSVAKNCKDVTVDLSTLNVGQMIIVDFTQNHKVWVYKRTEEQIAEAIRSKSNGYESKYAGWWATEKHPLDGKVTTSSTRSMLKEYFVFWPYSPIHGYYLTYIGKEYGKDFERPWSGGFFDVVNGAVYDTTGRPLFPDLLKNSDSGISNLTKISLMIPKHKFSSDGQTMTLLCK